MSLTDPKVSVVIPAFNAGTTIRACLTSVFSQEFTDFEVILVDDGSTDRSVEIAQRFYDKRIRVVKQQNSGRASARNTGIKHAAGELIAFLDADDLWLPGKLSRQVDQMSRDPSIGLSYTDGRFTGDNGQNLGFVHDRVKLLRGHVFEPLLLGDNFILTSSTVVRKRLFDEIGGFDSWFARLEDLDMWLRIARSYRFDYVDEPLVDYRVHEAYTSWANYPALHRRELLYLVQKNGIDYQAHSVSSGRIRRLQSRIQYIYAFFMIEKRAWKEANQGLIAAAKLNPYDFKIYLRWVQLIILSLIYAETAWNE